MNRDCIVVSMTLDYGIEHHVFSLSKSVLHLICAYDASVTVQSIVKSLTENGWNVLSEHTQSDWRATFADVYRICPSLLSDLGSSWFIYSTMDK